MHVIVTKFTNAIGSAAVSPDGRWLAAHPAGDGPILAWDLLDPSAEPLRIPASRTGRIAFNPNGRFLARTGPALSREGVLVRPFPGTGRARRAFPERAIQQFVFTPDGADVIGLEVDGRVHRWHIKTWAEAPRQLDLPPAEVYAHGAMALHPAGRVLALTRPELRDAEIRSTLIGWDYPNGVAPAWTVSYETEVAELVFSPDGLHLVGLVRDGVVIWDSATLAVRTRLRPDLSVRPPGGSRFAVGRPAFTPDGRLLALGCHDGTVRFYDTMSWTEYRVFDWVPALGDRMIYPHGYGRPIGAVQFTADGTRAVAAYPFHLVVWDVDV